MPDAIVNLPEIAVMYVAGDKNQPISEQAPRAFIALEAKLPSLKGRKFYGAVVEGEYRACVALTPAEAAQDALPHPRWTIPGGHYARRRIADWERHRDLIGPIMAELCNRSDFDPARPTIEFYRSQKELLLFAPVR